ncbi:hypothetical protein B9T31_05925 [Acinetobacter sp. ANC 4558]|uniref:hypothetical protein n=1 Tax=Acinetobacter sp. ANC 4558 TaxID=1977876 RepID=UPI000A34A71D|nr:hypothetical protein [Acinetobacter sp. ANC 4558]OTG87144.1 hypothetical protein B9T31_05925 [Acinetobacter sp. ANC 4558]
MKSVLVILTKSNLNSLQIYESLSATMVLATFGCDVKVLLQDAALNLLKSELQFNSLKHAFKLASNLVDSFEFYDLSPIYLEKHQQSHLDVFKNHPDIEFIELNSQFIKQFDHVLYW